MARREQRNLLVGIDAGSAKCAVVIGQLTPEDTIELLGYGVQVSRGIQRGDVVNIEQTTQAIRRAVENAEHMAGCRVQSAMVGISGTHLRGHNSSGVAAVRMGSVTERDVDAVVDAARAIAIPDSQKILHVLPQEFIVDGRDGIQDPVGMHGVRLEAKVHIATGAIATAQNLYKCVESCGLKVDKLIMQHLAASYAVLLPEERELGVGMIDIGGGTTDIAVFRGGSLRQTWVLPVAGGHVTSDIGMAFRIPAPVAEDLKLRHGVALSHLTAGQPPVEVRSIGEAQGRLLSPAALTDVIKPRYDELFRIIRGELQRGGWYEQLGSGIVLTGGAAMMPGVPELAEHVFGLPVRLGLPQVGGNIRDVNGNAAYAAAVGLMVYGHQSQPSVPQGRGLGDWVRRARDWIKVGF